MPQDKQLCGVSLDAVVEKRRLDQALNAKEFAVLAGISYSSARAWFRLPGFPVVRGVVFWEDFVQWRRDQIRPANEKPFAIGQSGAEIQSATPRLTGLPSRAAKILAQAG